MNKKTKMILLCSSIGAAVLILFTVYYLVNRIPSNPEETVGNTAGNLNNGGLFCESEGKVYFSNAYDNGCLYSMNVNETDFKKLNTVSTSSINAGGNYLYYYMDNIEQSGGEGLENVMRSYGVYRTRKNGKDASCLLREPAVIIQLTGNYLYFQHYSTRNGTTLEKVRIDNSESETIADYVINPASCDNGIIYFNGTGKNHYLYTLNTENDSISVLWRNNIWNPVYDNGYVYYMDMMNDYRLCRYSITEDIIEILTDDRIDFYNLYGNQIYYQKSSPTDPALKRMPLTGGDAEIIAQGVYENINITSEYVYFNEFGHPSPVYHTPTEGPVAVSAFNAARDAAMQ